MDEEYEGWSAGGDAFARYCIVRALACMVRSRADSANFVHSIRLALLRLPRASIYEIRWWTPGTLFSRWERRICAFTVRKVLR